MTRSVICLMTMVLVFASVSSAQLTPTGDYTITFERGKWSETRTISVQPFATPEPFYTVGGEDVNVYLELTDMYGLDDSISGYAWYVNAPAVLDDPIVNTLLGGSGDLAITISGLEFAECPSSLIVFQPLVTHLYYVAEDFSRKYVPGPVDPADWQRTPVRPLETGDPDYAAYGAAYGTPVQDSGGPDVKFVLPDLYVPDGTIWELSFGAGFSVVPEPSVLILLLGGFVGLVVRRCR